MKEGIQWRVSTVAEVLAVFWRRVVLWSLSASCPTLLDHDAARPARFEIPARLARDWLLRQDTVDGLRERLQYALSVRAWPWLAAWSATSRV